MPDKAKIIEGLKHCIAENCDGCPYKKAPYEDYLDCCKTVMTAALEALHGREQDHV